MINWKVFVKERSWSTEARSWYFSTEMSEKKDESGQLIFWSILGTDMPRTQVQKVTSNMPGTIS
jgi:hypothetical protein